MLAEVCGQQLELLPQKAVYWPSEKTLLVADLHLGKIEHFRRFSIPVPVKANQVQLETFVGILTRWKPERVIFLGDLFHSHYNPVWEEFGNLMQHFSGTHFELVLGNHDIMSNYQYDRRNILVFAERRVGPFLLTHAPVEPSSETYNLAGHLHPGVQLVGRGRQSVVLPCYYFGQRGGVLPSFGVFTGMYRIVPQKEDKIYVIAEEQVVAVA